MVVLPAESSHGERCSADRRSQALATVLGDAIAKHRKPFFSSPSTDIIEPSTTAASHYTHSPAAASCSAVPVLTPGPIVCVRVCWTVAPISLQSAIQRLWLLPKQDEQMVVLFDMRRGGGAVLGTRVDAPGRALDPHVHTVVNLWMDRSLQGGHHPRVSSSSLFGSSRVFLPPM